MMRMMVRRFCNKTKHREFGASRERSPEDLAALKIRVAAKEKEVKAALANLPTISFGAIMGGVGIVLVVMASVTFKLKNDIDDYKKELTQFVARIEKTK